MKIILSSTYNDDYFFYLPITTWCWNRFGYDVICFLPYLYSAGDSNRIDLVSDLKISGKIRLKYESFDSSKENEILHSQCIRLYAANLHLSKDDIIMTSDIDMIPLSFYWLGNVSEFVTYGRDLTDYHYPICYLQGTVKKWKEVMNLTGDLLNDMNRDIKEEPFSSSEKKHERWVTDQQIATKKIIGRKDIIKVDRGIDKNTGYPIGRIDRSAWSKSLLQKERIDAHLFRDGYKEQNWIRIIELIKDCLNPSEKDLNWMNQYRNDYLKLI